MCDQFKEAYEEKPSANYSDESLKQLIIYATPIKQENFNQDISQNSKELEATLELHNLNIIRSSDYNQAIKEYSQKIKTLKESYNHSQEENTVKELIKHSLKKLEDNIKAIIQLQKYETDHLNNSSQYLNKIVNLQSDSSGIQQSQWISLRRPRTIEKECSTESKARVPFIHQLFAKDEGELKVETLQSDISSQQHDKRGPYQKYALTIKEEALEKVMHGKSIKQVSVEMDIPKKNIRRWVEIGAIRKKGGGRKRMDEDMEQNLFNWCIEQSLKQHRPVSRLQIRSQALQLSKFPEKFKASKGWTDKFVKKNDLRRKIIKKLQDYGYYKHYQSRRKQDKQEKQENFNSQQISFCDDEQLQQDPYQMQQKFNQYKQQLSPPNDSVFESSQGSQRKMITIQEPQKIENLGLSKKFSISPQNIQIRKSSSQK